MIETIPNPAFAQETASAFQSNVGQADSVRAAALSGLQRLRAARASRAEREQTRLAQELGATDPSVQEIQAEVASDRQFARLLGIEVDRVNAQVPAVGRNGWAVYGFVWNAQLDPQPNLTVAIYDTAGTWMQQQFGYARTDDNGYFALTMRSPAATQTATGAAASRAVVSPPLVLHVINQSGTTLFIDTNVLTVTPGTVQYRPIKLDATPPSGPPRGGINEPAPVTKVAPTEIAKTETSRSTKKGRKKGK